MKRMHQTVLIVSTLLASWLGMQAVHETGHVLGAWVSGGTVKQVVLSPWTISRTDLVANPAPLFVVWAGPVFGVLCPVGIWVVATRLRMSGAFALRFIAGFCLIANGAYIAVGSFDRVGDCGEMLKQGSDLWQLWCFGAVTIPAGLWLWQGQGPQFGLGAAQGQVDLAVAYRTFAGALLLVVLACVVGGA